MTERDTFQDEFDRAIAEERIKPSGDDAKTARLVATNLGRLRFLGTAPQAVRLARIANDAAISPAAADLFSRSGISRCVFMFRNDDEAQGGFSSSPGLIFLNPFSRLLAPTLVHEAAHLEQEELGLSEWRNGIGLADMFLENRIGEAAAFVHALEASWEMSRKIPEAWNSQYGHEPTPFLNMSWQMLVRDDPQTRATAKAAAFKAFFGTQTMERYENRVLDSIGKMEPAELRKLIPAPKRPRKDYDQILAAHGFPGLVHALPDLDWNAPFWCGIHGNTHTKLMDIIAEKCPDLLPQACLPPVRLSFFSRDTCNTAARMLAGGSLGLALGSLIF